MYESCSDVDCFTDRQLNQSFVCAGSQASKNIIGHPLAGTIEEPTPDGRSYAYNKSEDKNKPATNLLCDRNPMNIAKTLAGLAIWKPLTTTVCYRYTYKK